MRNLRDELPPLSSLLAFEAAARHQNFTAAAEELHRTQSAISRQISALEHDLGISLFHRRHRIVSLTPEGRALQDAVSEGLGHIANRTRDIRGAGDIETLTIATGESTGSFWLMPRLASFRAAHPSIQTKLSVQSTSREVSHTDADVYLLYGQGNWPGLRSTWLMPETLKPVCSPAYLESRTIESLLDLTKADLLHLETSSLNWVSWNKWFKDIGIVPDGPLNGPIFTTYIHLMQACTGGQGVAMGSLPLVEGYLETGALVALTDEVVCPNDAYYMCIGQGAEKKPHVRTFVSWIMRETRGNGPANQ
ncbi:MAG: LysR substrate-binding domain-containing protein [Alphaproteobacteria bacterium]